MTSARVASTVSAEAHIRLRSWSWKTITSPSADSVAWYSERNKLDFIGRVRFRDSTATLDSRTATYFPRDDRLEAYGDVRLVNLETGSQLDGQALIYWRQAPGVRDTAEMLATNRPTVRYRSASDTAAEPYVIVGVLAERQFGRIRLFVNGENLTNVRQTRWQPLIRPDRAPDGRWTVDAWAPLEGRNINGGVRLRF